MNYRYGLLAVAALVLLPQAALADDKGLASILSKMPTEITECRPHDRAQEEADAKLLETAWELLKARDLDKLRALLPDLLAAGARAPDVPALPEKCDGKLYVYTDDIMTLLLATGAATAAEKKQTGKEDVQLDTVQMPPPPYARLHFIIGWLYFEQEQYETADKWFVRGLKNDPRDAMLASEHANALSHTGRSAEALLFVDEFMAANELSGYLHALMLRRRGYALGDLGRHDEAIAVYKESLKHDPGNEVAKSEIKWNKDQMKAKKKK